MSGVVPRPRSPTRDEGAPDSATAHLKYTGGPRGAATPRPGPRAQSTSDFRRCRAITIRCTSDVPSPISQILASRIMRSTGYSLV